MLIGLHMSRLIEFSFLYRGLGLELPGGERVPYLRSFLAGSAISAGWLPCIGPTLGAILTLALTSSTVFESSLLLVAYSLGLALPFVAFGAVLARAPGLTQWFARHHAATSTLAGAFMVLTGILLFTGALQQLNAYFNFSSSGVGASF
jgi:cytochrome c-type biogenesis protein